MSAVAKTSKKQGMGGKGAFRSPVRSEPAPGEAPLYLVENVVHYINGRLVEPGTQVRYAGVPGRNLKPLDAAAEAAVKEANAERAKRKAEADKIEAENQKIRAALGGA